MSELENTTTRSTPITSHLSRANLGSAGASRLPRTGSAASVVSSVSNTADRIEREFQNGSRTLVNGIGFPTVVAKKIPSSLLRVSKYTTNPFVDSVILTCFVDLYLDPPRTLARQPPQPAEMRRCMSNTSAEGSSVTSETIARGLSSPTIGSAAATRPSSRDLNNRQVSFFVSEKGQTGNSNNKSTLLSSPKSSPVKTSKFDGDPFSFVHDIDDMDDDELLGQGALLLQKQQQRSRQVCDDRHHPRGPYAVRVPNRATVAEATQLVHQYLRKKQLQEIAELSGNASGNAKTLFGQPVDIERAVEGLSTVPKKLQALNAQSVSLLSLATMDPIPEPSHQGGSSSSKSNPSSSGEQSLQLTLRPCDPLGYVLDRKASTASAFSPTKTLLSCFPKGCTSFFLCLAPDPEQVRHRIRLQKLEEVREKEEAQRRINELRQEQVEAIEATRRQQEAAASNHSTHRDTVLRREMFQPKGSDAYRKFVKDEVHEDKMRAREAADEAAAARREQLREAAEQQWRSYFLRLAAVQKASAEVILGLELEEKAERERIVALRQELIVSQRSKERCAVLLRQVPAQVEALRARESPFTSWKL